MATKSKQKTNNFLFHDRDEAVRIAEHRLICRDCAYWNFEKDHMNGFCSRTKQKTSLINHCYQTLEEMCGHEFY